MGEHGLSYNKKRHFLALSRNFAGIHDAVFPEEDV